MASGGYPGKYSKGMAIHGLDSVKDAVVFHAGTAKQEGRYVTSGGRVIGITAFGKDISEARKTAYANVKNISFEGAQYRSDIGIK
jgi:phosphoribosylamine--glycine ligase